MNLAVRTYDDRDILAALGIGAYAVDVVAAYLLDPARVQVIYVPVVMYESAERADTSVRLMELFFDRIGRTADTEAESGVRRDIYAAANFSPSA